MSAAHRSSLLALLVVPLLLAACATGSEEVPSPTPSATTTVEPSAAVTASDEPQADARWQRFSTANGMASITVPPTWTVEGGATSSEHSESQWIWVRNSLQHEMALLTISNGGDRGGTCGDSVIDGTSDVPARMHLVEEMDVAPDAPPAYLYAATVESATDVFAFHAGYSLERPADDRMPCTIFDDVAVPDGYPRVSFGVPNADIGGGLWRVGSFEAGEQYTETEEFDTLMDVLRSLRLEAGS